MARLLNKHFESFGKFLLHLISWVKSNFPELSEAITKDTLEEAKKTNTSVLVTTCPMCDACFLQAAKGSKMNVKELSELIVEGIE